MCENSGYKISPDSIDLINGHFKSKVENKGENFANAREARNFFETCVLNQANRLALIDNPSDEELTTLTLTDFM